MTLPRLAPNNNKNNLIKKPDFKNPFVNQEKKATVNASTTQTQIIDQENDSNKIQENFIIKEEYQNQHTTTQEPVEEI